MAVGILKGVTLKPYYDKENDITRSCCSYSIRIEGSDAEMEALYQALKPLFGTRVVTSVEPEQPELR
ncbi:MAG TPA: hypothetical protein VM285_00510 [Polyangia bacterium]|nr:hypothetical protein [Thermoleophilia bacterium]HUT76133.1 hypothetical protein [Polyangia bacterium]